MPSINVDSDALGEMYALGGYIKMVSDVNVESDTLISQMTEAAISANKITIASSHGLINVDSLSKGVDTSVIAIVDGQVYDDVDLRSNIVIQKGAALMGSDIAVVANAGTGSVTQATAGGGGPTDFTADTLRRDLSAASLVDVSGTFIVGPDTARLLVNANGAIQIKDFVNARIDSATGDVVVDGLLPHRPICESKRFNQRSAAVAETRLQKSSWALTLRSRCLIDSASSTSITCLPKIW